MTPIVPITSLESWATKFAPQAAQASIGRGEEIATILIRGGEVGIGLAAATFMNSRLSAPGEDHVKIRGIPVDGVLGLAGVFGSVMGWFGPMGKDVAMLSLGFALPAIARPVQEFGMQQRLARDKMAQQVASGEVADDAPPALAEPAKEATPKSNVVSPNVPSWARR